MNTCIITPCSRTQTLFPIIDCIHSVACKANLFSACHSMKVLNFPGNDMSFFITLGIYQLTSFGKIVYSSK